tara:strand:- start:10979 stop:11260 length:282 start_codon:yes stop_codon:yes gene_type:complete
MNYQLLLEYYSSGTELTNQELHLLDLELDTQLENISKNNSLGCLEIAPDNICSALETSNGSKWIKCLARTLDKLLNDSSARESRVDKILSKLS